MKDPEKTIRSLHFRYPNAEIVRIPNGDPMEIICEIEPTADHPEYSVAVVAIERSLPHHHDIATETYEVLSGQLVLKVGKKVLTLFRGKVEEIPAGVVHSAISEQEAWVRVTSRPGWTQDDHIMDSQTNGE